MASQSFESDRDREVQIAKDRRGYEKKRKINETSSSNGEEGPEEKYVVGIRSVSKRNGLFSHPHAVSKFVVDRVGEIKSVRVTRTGMVIVECRNKQQMKEMSRIKRYNGSEVECFPMRERPRKKGVISGFPLTIGMEAIDDYDCVYEARRMYRYKEGKKEPSESICITFEDELPDRMFIQYVCYRVRPFEAAPLRCFCCQEYGHVAAVCRGDIKCGRCGKRQDQCNGKCEEENVPVKCSNCAGNHYSGSAQCPERIKEVKVNKIRKEKRVTYAEAVKSVESKDIVEKQPETERKGNGVEPVICFEKGRFLAFIAMVINCAVDISRKTERIKMVLDAARRFLNIVDISGEDLNEILTEEFAPTPTEMSET